MEIFRLRNGAGRIAWGALNGRDGEIARSSKPVELSAGPGCGHGRRQLLDRLSVPAEKIDVRADYELGERQSGATEDELKRLIGPNWVK
jgi:hypothetical protein